MPPRSQSPMPMRAEARWSLTFEVEDLARKGTRQARRRRRTGRDLIELSAPTFSNALDEHAWV